MSLVLPWGASSSVDEVVEFGPRLLEALRTPLEDGEVRLARRDGVVRYPARC
jgi:magnesium chelatase family protein